MYELSEDVLQCWCKSIVTSRYQLLRSFETPFYCSLEHFLKRFFVIFWQLRVLNSYQNNFTLLKQYNVCNKYKTIHTCFGIARQIALDRYEEGFNSTFGHVVSFLASNSWNMSCYTKTSVQLCIFMDCESLSQIFCEMSD